MPEKHYLRQMQVLPLRAKVRMSEQRIMEWYQHFDGDVCISFSGGKDSTVLAALVHEWYPNVPLVFCNTGLEYPEIQAFARKMGAEFVRPKMMFSEVISKYGYPIISKENAEAIYYARKIRNSVGGGTDHTPYRSSKRCWAGDSTPESGYQRNQDQLGTAGTEQAQQLTGGGTSQSLFQGRTGWRRAALTDQIPSKIIVGGYQPRNAENSTVRAEFPWGGGMTDSHRKRSGLMGMRNEYDHRKLDGTGSDGDETASPG